MTSVFVYADGRVIWVRQGGAPAGANKSTSGFLEQRLTPEGVELLRSKVISTGLFRHDVDLTTGSAERRRPGRYCCSEARSRHAHWRAARPRPLDEPRPPPRRPQRLPGTYTGTTATPEQERALERLDPLLVDPAASLPASAWQDRRVRAYVAAKYATCWVHRPELGPDKPAQTIPPSRVLTLSQRQSRTYSAAGPRPLGRQPAHRLLGCADEGSSSDRPSSRACRPRKGVVGNGIDAGLGGLTYRLKAPEGRPGHIYVFFEPALPHGEWICTACG